VGLTVASEVRLLAGVIVTADDRLVVILAVAIVVGVPVAAGVLVAAGVHVAAEV
jgi:hypothetical protein